MGSSSAARRADDPHELRRFVRAQESDYDQALAEIKSGKKRTHWMWYVFPQIDGLAFSATSKRYAIKSLAEAKAYLDHPISDRGCLSARRRLSGSRTDPSRRSSVLPMT